MMDNSGEKAKSEFPIGREAIALKILGEYWLDFLASINPRFSLSDKPTISQNCVPPVWVSFKLKLRKSEKNCTGDTLKIICEDSPMFWNNFSSKPTQCVYAISSSRDECWIKNWENSSQERRIANLTFNKPKSNCVSSTIVSYPKAVCIARKKQKQSITALHLSTLCVQCI